MRSANLKKKTLIQYVMFVYSPSKENAKSNRNAQFKRQNQTLGGAYLTAIFCNEWRIP